MCNAIAEVSHKTKSLKPSSTVYTVEITLPVTSIYEPLRRVAITGTKTAEILCWKYK